ncbi:dienelactone hydrolase [Kockovaella imperatae]|uniref:Dienelactone hydrolase n=1 Tax=Kockovaella imperatae TaxID=4999 RepID=A0A1Y1U9Y5_9TREE|nr:dienelactone hydrolase [Kockovaella imperatae]ORX34822.1 dienelactone hydrolase [Kockovaella imperatae]
MSEQTEIKSCCVTGHLHQGQPLGSMETVHGVHSYVSKPKEASGDKVDKVILITDIFGIYNNTKLVADEWAGQGYEVYVPDFLGDSKVDEELLNTIAPNLRVQKEATVLPKAADTAKTGAAIGPFLITNREAVTKPKIEGFVQAVRAEPNTRHIAAIGFCWGGRYSLLLAQEDSPARVDCAIANHPSFLTNDDVKEIKSVPVAIFKGTQDAMMSDDALDEVEGILSKNLPSDKLVVQKFPDAVHGFTIRGDMEDGQEKQQKEDAQNAAIKFVKKAFGA